MSKNKVAITLNPKSLKQLVRLLKARPLVTGAHCGDD
jgi:hypothetical protein